MKYLREYNPPPARKPTTKPAKMPLIRRQLAFVAVGSMLAGASVTGLFFWALIRSGASSDTVFNVAVAVATLGSVVSSLMLLR